MSKEFKLVPASMLLDKTTIGAILFHCGDGSVVDLEECSEGLLWIGDVTDDDGKQVHGLHISTAEYPEEGSTTLVEFKAPQPPALGGEPIQRYCFDPTACEELDDDGPWVRFADHRVSLAPYQAEIESVRSMTAMLNDREWAEHVGKGEVSSALESAITELHNELGALRDRNAELESGLRIIAVSAKGSTIGGLRMIAKQSLNKAAALNKPAGVQS